MKNFVRTAYGDSDTYYGGDLDDLLQGGGQANPATPPMWTAISIVILNILSMYTPGAKIIASISLAITMFSAIMYVDDTDIFVLSDHQESVQGLLSRAQSLVDTWCRALWASGGVLRPENAGGYPCNSDGEEVNENMFQKKIKK